MVDEDLEGRVDHLEAEVQRLENLLDAYGKQLARVRTVIAGDDDAFWDLKPEREVDSLHGRVEIAEAKMSGFAQAVQSVKENGGDGS